MTSSAVWKGKTHSASQNLYISEGGFDPSAAMFQSSLCLCAAANRSMHRPVRLLDLRPKRFGSGDNPATSRFRLALSFPIL
jgi:hypothetical protein